MLDSDIGRWKYYGSAQSYKSTLLDDIFAIQGSSKTLILIGLIKIPVNRITHLN